MDDQKQTTNQPKDSVDQKAGEPEKSDSQQASRPEDPQTSKSEDKKGVNEAPAEESQPLDNTVDTQKDLALGEETGESAHTASPARPSDKKTSTGTKAHWYVVHTYSGHESKVSTTLKQRIDSEKLQS